MRKVIIALTCVVLFSCSRNSNHSGSSESGHETHAETMLDFTLWADSTEFFTECPALVKGETAELMVHVTRLTTYKPYPDGTVTVEFGEAKISADSTEVPGIFQISLHPDVSGMQPIRISFKRGSLLEQVTDSVMVYASDEEASANLRSDADPAVISYGKEQAWESDFMVQQVIPGPFTGVIRASGEMLPVPGEKQHVVARTGGIVLFASRDLVQGRRVVKGQLLFTLSGQDLADDNIGVRFTEARNRFQQSRSEYERHSRLHAESIISDKQFYETLTRYRTDSATFYSLSTNASSKGQNIYAPLTGYLHELNIAEGQYVRTGDQLATISANQVMLLRADVPQQYFKQLNLIETAHFRPAYSDRIYTIEELNGHLLARGASVAENNHYMPVYFEVSNDGSLLEGAFADFYLLTRPYGRSVVVPVTSVIEEQGNNYVFVQQDGAGYTRKAVLVSDGDGINIVVESGLLAGERVVTRGAMLLKAASMSSAMPQHNHEH